MYPHVPLADLKCLFFNRVYEHIQAVSYDVGECADDLDTIHKFYRHYRMRCLTSDFIRKEASEETFEACDRSEFIDGTPE